MGRRVAPDIANALASRKILRQEERLVQSFVCSGLVQEAVPPEGKTDNYGGPGPPYALLQGNLVSASNRFCARRRGIAK